jgi:hypothetical protein
MRLLFAAAEGNDVVIAFPRLLMALYISVDIADKPAKLRVFVYVKLEKEEMVDGRFPITGPPNSVRLDTTEIQVVPPSPSVTSVCPVLNGRSVFESNA